MSRVHRERVSRSFKQQPAREYERHCNAGFLHHDQRHAGQRRRTKTVLQKQQQGQRSECHGGHVELREHRLRVEQRAQAKHRYCGERGRAGDAACELNRQQERRQYTERREQQHRDARGQDAESKHVPRQRQPGHHDGRMNVRRGAVGDERAAPIEIGGGGNELAGFVPIIRELEERQVRGDHDHRRRGENQQVRRRPNPSARLIHQPIGRSPNRPVAPA